MNRSMITFHQRVHTCSTLIAWMLVGLMLSSATAHAQGRATIDGLVVGPSDLPQANVTMILTNAQGIDRRAVSEANGQFVFGGLQPGTYRLRTDDDTFAPFSQADITLAAGQTLPLRVALQPRVLAAAAPAARARVEGTVIGPNGRPAANVTVILTNPQGIDRREVTDGNGAYVLGGLQPGSYRIRVDEPGDGAQAFPPESIPLTAGEQRQFVIRLQPVPAPVVIPQPPAAPPPTPTVTAPAVEALTAATPAASPQVAVSGVLPPRRRDGVVPEVTAEGGDFEVKRDRWDVQWPEEWRRYQRYPNNRRQPWVIGRPLDPYNQNPAKADFPIAGSRDLFANLNLQLNSTINPREVAAGASQQQLFTNHNFVGGLELFKGDTVFQPKAWAIRSTVVANLNENRVESAGDLKRRVGVEEAFAEGRLAVLGPSFDFVSVRGGMQNFNSDFRGYLFVDNQLGVRLFGNARSNRDQYNVAYFAMRNRDQVSQLHQFTSRNQSVLIANYYIQDFGAPGYTAMFNVHVNDDRGPEDDPHALRVTYAGFHGDGKWGNWGVSQAFYQAFGHDSDNAVASRLSGAPAPVTINAQMAALELSRDADWRRYRGSFFYASGDNRSDPARAHGFDSITDNPNLAGGQFMFWTQQATKTADLAASLKGSPLQGLLSEKFSLLPSLRSKFLDRANFVNPGLLLANGGVDLRLSPQLKVVANLSYLRFADPAVLQQLVRRANAAGFEDSGIGWDIGAGAKFRPFVNENLFVVLGFSTLLPRGGFATALGSTQPLYSLVGAVQLAY